MKIEEQNLNEPQKPQLNIGAVMRCFMIAYSFDNYGCYTVERFYGTDKDDCRERFWKDRPTANQIHCMEERF